MKRGGDQLLLGRIFEQIAGELFNRELIERQIAVECGDDPVAIRPGIALAQRILAVAVGIGVACEVQPHARPLLAVSRRREEAIDDFFVRVHRFVLHEGVHFCRRRRQADQIERKPTHQCIAIRAG